VQTSKFKLKKGMKLVWQLSFMFTKPDHIRQGILSQFKNFEWATDLYCIYFSNLIMAQEKYLIPMVTSEDQWYTLIGQREVAARNHIDDFGTHSK